MAEDTAPAATDAPPTDSPESGEKTFTQEQVNDLIARQKGDVQRKYADYDDLKSKASKLDEIEHANASDLEKAQAKVTKAEEAAAAAAAKLLRYEVGTTKEVPTKLFPLLTGSTQEELEAQADLILENAKPGTPDFDGGAREPAADPDTPEVAHDKLLLGMFGTNT